MVGKNAGHPKRLGPYELVQPLATGGMAEVYIARRDGPHGFTKTVALKRILPQLAQDQDFVSMFIDEARVCAQLSHPNLVQVFDFGEAEDELYMAMEYVDGTTCAKAVRKAAANQEIIPFEASIHIILSVLRGLEYAHAAVDMDGIPLGLVHRDVSPGNILLARSGAVKLSDFGIARADDFERRTEEGQLKGKLGYMSPEQVTGKDLDARSDLFTLGIVFAELLTSRPLFGTGNELDVLMKIRDADLATFDRHCTHIPGELQLIVRKSLARKPQARFQSATEFADALDDFARQQRVAVSASRLVTWLTTSGLVVAQGSGEFLLESLRAGRRNEKPRSASPASTPQARFPSQLTAPDMLSDKMPEGKDPSPPAGVTEQGFASDYRITLKDRTLGPLSYARLVELFATGRGSPDSLVSRGGGAFRPARDLPELARILLSPAVSIPPKSHHRATERWDVDRNSHASRLFDLVLRKATGLLLAHQGEHAKKFFLVDGVPAFTASTEKGELLGQQLVARGLVLPMEVDMALALCPRYGGRLGDALVGLGVLRPVELYRALVAQTHERIAELAAWRNGTLEFIPGMRADDETILSGAAPLEIVAKGVLNAYEEQELENILLPFMDQEIRSAPPVGVSVQDLRLERSVHSILESIEEPTTMRNVLERFANQSRSGRYDVFRALFVGLSAKLLVSTGWPPRAPIPSIPTMKM